MLNRSIINKKISFRKQIARQYSPKSKVWVCIGVIKILAHEANP